MKKQLYVIAAIIFFCCNNLKAQTLVHTAAELLTAINCTTGCADTIFIADTTIYLGQLTMDKFPLELKNNIVIMGTFNLFKPAAFQGSTIISPYRFRNLSKCSPDGNNQACVFSMKGNNCAINNIKLIGPQTSINDYRENTYEHANNCDQHSRAALEGLSAGIIVHGMNARVSGCEILGFSYYATKLHPIHNYHYDATCTDTQDHYFYLDNCYIHNNKGYGFGYGLYICNGDEERFCTTTEDCLNATELDGGHYFNYEGTEAVAYVTRCVFVENATDLDGSGDRSSYYIDGNTFLGRGVAKNIYRHDQEKIYIHNPQYPTTYIKYGIGGNIQEIKNNIFYGSGFEVTYPNINDCDNAISTQGFLRVNNNAFYSSDGSLDDRMQVRGLPYTTYSHPSHDHLSFTNNRVFDRVPFHAFERTPYCVIRARTSSGVPSTTEQTITVGETLYFDTEFCYDSYGNYGNASGNKCIYMWRFHENPNDLDGEIRTAYVPAGSPLPHTFTIEGNVGVTVWAIDTVTHKASPYAQLNIVVKPANPAAHTYLCFSIKDSYVGRPVKSFPGCTSYSDNNDAPDTTSTGFVKYVKFNNKPEAYLKDIAGDDGWEYYKIEIDSFIKSDSIGGKNDTIEIGLKALYPVSAEKVRAVVLFVDDVYINKPDGSNIILNGNFEDGVDDWTLVGVHNSMTFRDTCPNDTTEFEVDLKQADAATIDVRSGSRSFWGYVKALTYIADGWTYPSGVYKGIKQTFNLNTCLKKATIKAAWPQAQCSNEGVLLTANEGSAYQWKLNGTNISGATSQTYTAHASGSYTVAVTNTCGTTTSEAVTLTIKTSPTVTATASAANVCPGQAATLIASGSYIYNWIASATLDTLTNDTTTAHPSAATDYYVVGTDSSGCKDTALVHVGISTITVSVSSGDDAICYGKSTMLTATGGSSYVWSPSTGLDATTGSSVTASPLTTTTYKVVGTNAYGCKDSSTTEVVVNVADINVSATDDTICNGTSTLLTATGGVSYIWSPSNGLDATSGSSVTASPSTTTTYKVIGTDANGCLDSSEITIIVNVADVNVSAIDDTICNGTSTVLTATGGVSYIWSPSTGLDATTGSSVTASPSTTTTYKVVGTDDNGCLDSAEITIVVNVADVNVSATDDTICNGTSTTLTATGGVSYIWSPSTGLDATTGSSVTASPSTTTTYKVIGTDATGCIDSATVTITVNTADVNVSATSNTICAGTSTTLTATGSVSYLWSPSTGLDATSGSSVMASPSTTTTYKVIGTDANGCIDSSTVTITVNVADVNVSATSTTICAGTYTTLTATGGVSYEWSPSTGLSATTGSSVTASPTTTTTYTVVGTDVNGCTDAATITITVNTADVNVSATSTTICNGTSTTLTATGGSSYSWSPATGLSGTTGSGVTASPTTTTTYTVVGTDVNGCTDAATITITVNVVHVNVTASADSICGGFTDTLVASGALTYSWSPSTGLNTTTGATVYATPTSTTTYTVTGTDVNGCTDTETKTVTIRTETGSTPSQPNSISGQLTGLCNISVTLTSSSVSGATYLWTVPSFAYIESGQGTRYLAVHYNTSSISTENTCVYAVGSGCKKSTVRCVSTYGKPGTFPNPSGPSSPCKDTVIYTISSWPDGPCSKTWMVSPSADGDVLSTSDNSHADIKWKVAGASSVLAIASNSCGSRTNTKSVTVNNCRAGDLYSEESSTQFSVYPNPAVTDITVNISSIIKDDATVIIYDALGKEVVNQVWNLSEGNNTKDISVNKLATGSYMVVLKSKEQHRMEKLVIIR